jgi:hypothetical protein
VTAFLNKKFTDRSIGKGGVIAWLARSPNLSSLDYFPWGHMKSLVYAVNTNSTAELLNRIMESAAHTKNDRDSVKRAVTSITRRVQLCVENQGGQLE